MGLSTRALCIFVLAGCRSVYGSEDIPVEPPVEAGTDAADASSASDAPIGLPVHAPSAIMFRDEDPRSRFAKGTITIVKATDESDVLSYTIYWGSPETAKVREIGTLPKTGADVTFVIDEPIPTGATHLLAFSANAAGEAAAGIALGPVDGFPSHTDLSAGKGTGSGTAPRAVIDVAGGKLLVASKDQTNNGKPSLFRCNLDGSGCTHRDISSGQGTDSAVNPAMVIDTVGNKVLVVTENGADMYKPALYRCELDGTGCAYKDIAAGEGVGSGYQPSVVIDKAGGKLLVVVRNGGLGYAPGLFRSNLDGSSPQFIDISAAQPNNSGDRPSAVVDTMNAKLLVVTEDNAKGGRPGLFRCNLDGSSCAYVDISAGQGVNSGRQPSALIDAVNQKLLVVTANGSQSMKPGLFRCNLDGTGCTFADISAGRGTGSGVLPSAVIDTAHAKLLVATQDGSNGDRPALFRCNLDGTSCSYADLSAGQGTNSGMHPTALVDGAAGKLLVVASNGASSSKPSLFSLLLW